MFFKVSDLVTTSGLSELNGWLVLVDGSHLCVCFLVLPSFDFVSTSGPTDYNLFVHGLFILGGTSKF